MSTTEEQTTTESTTTEEAQPAAVEMTDTENPFNTSEAEKPFDPNAEHKDEDGLILGKYKDVAALKKGYRELSSKLQEKKPEAPENYEINLGGGEGDNGLEFDKEDPIWKEMEPIFKESNLSNEAVTKIIAKYNETLQKSGPDLAVEKEKLGAKADERIAAIEGYVHQGKIPSKFHDFVPLIAQTANGIEFIEFMMEGKIEQNIPSSAPAVSAATVKENTQRVFDWKASQEDFGNNEFKQKKYDRNLWLASAGKSLEL